MMIGLMFNFILLGVVLTQVRASMCMHTMANRCIELHLHDHLQQARQVMDENLRSRHPSSQHRQFCFHICRSLQHPDQQLQYAID